MFQTPTDPHSFLTPNTPSLYSLVGGDGKTRFLLDTLSRKTDISKVVYLCAARRVRHLESILEDFGHARWRHLYGRDDIPEGLTGTQWLHYAQFKAPDAKVVVIDPGYLIVGSGSVRAKKRVLSLLDEIAQFSHDHEIATYLILSARGGVPEGGEVWNVGVDERVLFARRGVGGPVDLYHIGCNRLVLAEARMVFDQNGRLVVKEKVNANA